ncbi:uncharacterized protein LOC113343346 [Papaver somniferum]|uniref:uncharacterized protein LOC113343346 n=1 Tax=Papaver somniferum TaxID=3469 RepID=UPI000E6FED65|nr:uncharacterized protein LOC113343346 [Papaver somniferum]
MSDSSVENPGQTLDESEEKLCCSNEVKVYENNEEVIPNKIEEIPTQVNVCLAETHRRSICSEEKEGELALDVIASNSYELPGPVKVFGFDSTEVFTTNKIFGSKDEVVKWCRDVGKKKNMVIVIVKGESKNQGGKGLFVELSCERSGKHRKLKIDESLLNPNVKRRKGTSTKKCRCPFRLRSACLDTNTWKLTVRVGYHNHLDADTLLGHAYAARLTNDEEEDVILLAAGGAKPKSILNTIKEKYPDNVSTVRTIRNAKLRHGISESAGRTILQLLHAYLDQNHYVTWNRRIPETDELTDIFWANPEFTICARCFPSMVIIDCTYKTNR